MQSHYQNRYWVNTIDELFKPETKWIGVMDGRDCDTGLLAFAYPEDKYGYVAYTQVTIQQALELPGMLTQRGFVADRENAVTDFLYKVPGSKWWTDFSENLVSVST